MHTARQLEERLFSIAIEGRGASRAQLFGDYGPLSRFGVVVHEPYGAVGASYLLQLAITAFYDARPERRDRSMPVYPDVFVFHVGGRLGDHADFDVYPPRKEVFVQDDPVAVLNAINDRGITHLAVPDRAPERVQHEWKEPAQAIDRIAAAWVYSPSGRVADSDVAISSTSPRTEANAKMALHAEESYHERQQALEALGDITVPPDERLAARSDRRKEVSIADRDRIRDARAELDRAEGRTETYRRVAVADALRRLHRGAAPAFQPSGEHRRRY
jgi:hypothetical protein